MEYQADDSPERDSQENDSNVSTEESEPDTGETPPEDFRTYIIVVNDDGSLTLDPNGQISEDADPQTVIPVPLPVNKMKSQDCPLPGAIPVQGSTGRSRKTKPQAVNYNGQGSDYDYVGSSSLQYDPGQQQNVNGILQQQLTSDSSSTTAASSTEFIDELGPQDMAILEKVLLQSTERGETTEMRELLENFSFPPTAEAPTISASVPSIGVTNHLWDHSYSMVHPDEQPSTSQQQQSIVQGPFITENIQQQQQQQQMKKSPNVPVSNQPAKSIISRVTFSNSSNETPPPVVPRTHSPNITSSSSSSSTPTSRRVSEGESNAANIRRSQRQQDRIERQEAERIMAENQELLRREKEMMESGGGIIAPGYTTPKQIDSIPVPTPPTTTTTTMSPSTTYPFKNPITGTSSPITVHDDSSTDAHSLSHSISPTTVKTFPDENQRSDRRPKRDRKLPAHLADPNYIHLEDESKILIKETVMTNAEDATEEQLEQETKSEEEEEDDEDSDNAEEEDDPNKLWCICRQPHNGRFMICCDKCDDWFHGKCVGITKAQAALMEQRNILWHCPQCKKTIKQTPPTKSKVGRPAGRRGSESTSTLTSSPGDSSNVKDATQVRRKSSSSISETPKSRNSVQVKAIGRKSDTIAKKPQTEISHTDDDSTDCVVCGKKARPASVYCSDECVVQHANRHKQDSPSISSTSNINNNAANSSSSGPQQQQRLKRMNSLKEQEKAKEKEAANFLSFHVIHSGASKSTEVVPARPKEPTHGKANLNTSGTATSPVTTHSKPNQSPTKSTPTTPTHSHPQQQPHSSGKSSSSKSGHDSSSITKHGGSRDKDGSKDHNRKSEKETTKQGTKASHGKSEKTTPKEKKTKIITKESQKEAEKEKDAKFGRDGETLMKENIRKAIREILKTRLKDVTEEEKAAFPASSTPEYLADRIEEELTLLYGGANTPKCKAKYRSIYFNLRDAKNFLFREILQGNIKPSTLVRMEPTDMASAELSEWRNRENQKNLEMIKKAELDKLAEAKKQELLDKGAEVEAVEKVEEEARKLDIADVIGGTKETKSSSDNEKREGDSSEKSSSSKSHSSHHRKDKKRDKHKDKYHHSSKDRHSSSSSSKDKQRERKDSSSSKDKDKKLDRHRSRDELETSKSKSKDSEKDKSSSSSNKDKSKPSSSGSSSSKDKEREHKRERGGKRESDKYSSSREKDPKTLKHQDSSEKFDIKSQDANISPDDSQSHEGTPLYSSSESSNQTTTDSAMIKQDETAKYGVRYSTDSEQELPSSTIKTPDFTDEKKEKPIFRTKLMMHELGAFGAGVYHVSHNHLEGVIFPESPVPIVGRISPDTVWDYIDKMKKTKEVIVLRLAPDTQSDSEGYMTFFTYLSSRGRLGVMGGLIPPLKDVYLIPLDKHGPVNRSLLPFRGPGLPKDRNHCLLAVVTRHMLDAVPPMIQPKRKASLVPSDSNAPLKKKKSSPTENNSSVKLSPRNSSASSSRIKTTGTPPFITPSPLRKSSTLETSTSKLEDESKQKQGGSDDDTEYVPWEEEDDKEEVIMEVVGDNTVPTPTEKEKPKALELLEQLDAQIQQRRQEIENIAGAIKRNENLTHIPGLDGDFPSSPKESSSPPPSSSSSLNTSSIPFFLRGQAQQEQQLKESNLPVTGNETVPTPSTSKSNLVESTKKITEKPTTEDEEAYSPSAINFSDEESKEDETITTSGTQKIGEKNKTIVVDMDEDDDDDQLSELPPGVEPEDLEQIKIPTKPPEIINLDDEDSSTHKNVVKELLEPPPPPPRELLESTDREFKSLPKPLSSTSDSIFSFTPLNVNSPKNVKKIQINLAPKSSLGASSVLSAVANTVKEVPLPPSSPATTTHASPLTKSISEEKVTINLEPKDSSSSSSSIPQGINTSLTSPIKMPVSSIPTSIPLHPSSMPSLSNLIPTNIPPPNINIPPPRNMNLPPPPNISSSSTTTNIQPSPILGNISLHTPPPPTNQPNIGGLNININVPPPTMTGMVAVSSIPPLPNLRGMPNTTNNNVPPPIRFPPQQQQQLGRFGLPPPTPPSLSGGGGNQKHTLSAATSFPSSLSSSTSSLASGTMLLSSSNSVLLRQGSSSSLPQVNNKNFSDTNKLIDESSSSSKTSSSGSYQGIGRKRHYSGRNRSRSRSNDRGFRSRSRSPHERRRKKYSRSRSPRRRNSKSRSPVDRPPRYSRDRSKSPSSSSRSKHYSSRSRSPGRKSSFSSRSQNRGGRSRKSRTRSRSVSPIVSTPVVKK